MRARAFAAILFLSASIAIVGCATTGSDTGSQSVIGDPSDTVIGLAESAGMIAYTFLPEYRNELGLSCETLAGLESGETQAALLRILQTAWANADSLQMAVVILSVNVLVDRTHIDATKVSDTYATAVLDALCHGVQQAKILTAQVGH